MKTILVLSDSHGNKTFLKRILKTNDADQIVFLGDGLRDFEDCFEEVFGGTVKGVCMVKGNCDLGNLRPAFARFELGGHSFLCLHGYYPNVKISLDGLVDVAEENSCKTVLFGHTHMPELTEKNGITMFNPGAVAAGHYGVIQIDEETGKMTFSHLII